MTTGINCFRKSLSVGMPKHLSATAAKSLQSCPTLCDPIDGSPPGSPVPGILLARTLEWVAISFSDEWEWKVKGKSLSRVWLFATPWTAVYQAPPPMGFSRQEYWGGVPLPLSREMYISISLQMAFLLFLLYHLIGILLLLLFLVFVDKLYDLGMNCLSGL